MLQFKPLTFLLPLFCNNHLHGLSCLYRLNKPSSLQLSSQELFSKPVVILGLILPEGAQLVLVSADLELLWDALKALIKRQGCDQGAGANEHQNESSAD